MGKGLHGWSSTMSRSVIMLLSVKVLHVCQQNVPANARRLVAEMFNLAIQFHF